MTSFQVSKPRRRRGSKRGYKKSGVFATAAGQTFGGTGGSRRSILAAAKVFADQAKKNASRFSTRIPPATGVEGYGEQEAMVVTDGAAAPNAAPFEFGLRHPLNYPGQTGWGKQPTRAYMSNAARNQGALQRAADIYGDAEAELLAEEFGFTE